MPAAPAQPSTRPPRVLSIDALRGLVMFAMILVNDIAPAEHLPWWMQHYSKDKPGGGLTFVDLVFPAFLFIVGMSIPFALGGRLARGEPLWKLLPHILVRTLSLLLIGVMMVNAASGPDTAQTIIHAIPGPPCSTSPPSFPSAPSEEIRHHRPASSGSPSSSA